MRKSKLSRGIIQAKIKFKEIIEKIITKPVLTSFSVFILALILVVGFTIIKYGYTGELFKNILIEAHGMLFDILVIGILILWLNKIGEKKREVKRYQDEIDDFRNWPSDEAKFRIIGNIKRLKRLGINKINLSDCYLVNAPLRGFQLQNIDFSFANLNNADLAETSLQNAFLWGTNLQGVFFYLANLQDAFLREANLQGSDLRAANLMGANLMQANLLSVKNLTVKQISSVKTLFQAILDPDLQMQIEKDCPHLLEEPEELKEKK